MKIEAVPSYALLAVLAATIAGLIYLATGLGL